MDTAAQFIQHLKYVEPHHLRELIAIAQNIQQRYTRPPPSEIWHYTGFEGLSGIVQSGSIYTTQVSCLNDSLEQTVLGDIIQQKIQSRPVAAEQIELENFRKFVDRQLSMRDMSATHHFVGCFTEEEDDLSQWRGYGTGECGYAIGFDTNAIIRHITPYQKAFLFPMLYDVPAQMEIADKIIEECERWFSMGCKGAASDIEKFSYDIFSSFNWTMDGLASIIKHHKFHAEKEWRLLVPLSEGDMQKIVIKQKRTLLARHLPFDLRLPGLDADRLPMARVYVGPGPAQKVTGVSLKTYLDQLGYNVEVWHSRVPFRVP